LKGLVRDPDLTQSQCSDLDKGLYASREIMVRIAELGLPVVTKMYSPLVIPFLDDVLAMGVIEARTTESQTHRELASDVFFSLGFKNGTDVSLGVAVDATKSPERQHTLLGVAEDGGPVQKLSPGNSDTFVVLRGGKHGPKYSPEHVREAQDAMIKAGKPIRLVIDYSYGN
jgi:3-deoxy-7-phosphoheptulonate synthase